MYAIGRGVIKNERTAVDWYTKAAKQGYAVAQKNLLLIHKKNIKAQKEAELQKAAAAHQKSVAAQKEAEFQKAAAAHQKAVAAQKEVEFQKVATEQEVVNKAEKAEQWFNLGMAAYNIQNYVIALDKFQKAANQGSAKAQYKLGVMYNNGYGIVKNERTAVEWFQKAADQGDAHAQYNLSLIHEKNIKAQKKVEFQKAAAAQKVVNQAEQLKQDTMTKTKVYISSNHKENDISNNWWLIIGFVLFFLCLLSISNNKTSIVRNDNNIIENTVVTSSLNNQTITTDTTLDDTESDEVKKIRLAAEGNTINEQGDAKAQYTLGVMYENGQSVVKNERTAVEWYTKAAEQGFAQAQYNLGVSYAKGLGVIKNMKTAYFWWLLASASGDEYAKNNIRVIENKINSEEKQVAQDAAANWRPKQ
jgi:TPR repeat protein